ncbi:hypothetical protein E2P86_09910 [Sphingobacterium psychroaquaticum]|uniref:carbohydrate-binding family 9-like protein n=1 Tax=Sphingobacterium psychroaquaticum TaxID=561061 RepID=UPI001069401B|nr:carbohydrate-binding family 9-like protein [Sphingobacterium psychroaquaticum]QBQ41452.1 hypothetical protein E2P86_09910 [Sphingobacterium psychroaquaticum]
MSILHVPQVEVQVHNFDYHALQQQLTGQEWHEIGHVNWPAEYPYKPKVAFQIVHNGSSIVLHYAVEEDYVKAQYIRPNEAVWEDSCVEFFLSLDNKETYYNIEFNVLGTGLIGYGPGVKSERNRLTPQEIEQVSTATSVVQRSGAKKWNMIMVIPALVFNKQGDITLSGLRAFGNFYKCGDELPQPHFISWSPIGHPTPNFHLPAFFGELIFE